MKTYKDYVNEWENSTESRDLSLEEWLMLQLEKKDQQFKEYLEKRRNKVAEIDTKDYEGWEMYYMADITEIINEFFKED